MRPLVKVMVAAAVLVLVSASPASATKPGTPRDTQPPSSPTNLRATQVTQTSATLAWDPSTDNQQVVFYGAWAPGLPVAYVNHPATTATFTGLHPGTAYAFRVQAWDGANWSWPSPILTVTTQPDAAPRCLSPCDRMCQACPGRRSETSVGHTDVSVQRISRVIDMNLLLRRPVARSG